MFVYLIVVYDVAEERVNKVNKFLKRYLYWIQNSVFEGQVSRPLFEEIKSGLSQIIDDDYDAIYFFKIKNPNAVEKEVMGTERGEPLRII